MKLYYPFAVTSLGRGAKGHAFKIDYAEYDRYDSNFTVRHNDLVARKKFFDKCHLDYELCHFNELHSRNQDVLSKYFCEIYRAYSVKTLRIPLRVDCVEVENSTVNYYLEMELLAAPKWRLLGCLPYNVFTRVSVNLLRKLILILLEIHYTCDQATYYDINPNNIFVNCEIGRASCRERVYVLV